MRLMSFALTTDQVRAQTKRFTRRRGWRDAKACDVVQPIVKGQGLKKGEQVQRIGGPIRFVSVRSEPLSRMTDDLAYGQAECVGEGFPELTPQEFVAMFCVANRCEPTTVVQRIEFEYLTTQPHTIGKERERCPGVTRARVRGRSTCAPSCAHRSCAASSGNSVRGSPSVCWCAAMG